MNFKNDISKFGTAGLFLTAILSPCCFPLFTFITSALGFGSFEILGEWTMWIFQGMLLLSLVGFYITYHKYKYIYPLIIAVLSSLTIFYAYHFNESDYWNYFIYVGMSGFFIATIWNYQHNKKQQNSIMNANQNIQLVSVITCPNCNYKKSEIMPTDTCAYFYDCENCKATLKPLPNDCCVYCSFGTVKCPPMQGANNCCS